jgi:hypothetical protein
MRLVVIGALAVIVASLAVLWLTTRLTATLLRTIDEMAESPREQVWR